MQVTVKGGRSSISSAFARSSVAINTVSDATLTLGANTTGYIYLNSSNAIAQYTGNIYALNGAIPLYYFVTSSSAVTTLEDCRHSFKAFNFNPDYQYYLSTWSLGTSYNTTINFRDTNTEGNSTNIFPQRVQLFCKTAELGYSVNDQVSIYANEPAIVVTSGFAYIITNSTAPQVLNRTSGSVGVPATITPANWGILAIFKPAQ